MKSLAQEGRKVKPILPTTPSHSTDRKRSRTNLTGLKPAEDIFFSSFPLEFVLPFCPSFFFYSFFLPLLFYSFFLPSFLYFFILIFVKIPSFFLLIFFSFFLLSFPSPFPFSLLPFFFFFFLLFFFFPHTPLSLFPTGETIKPGVLKRPELDCVRHINVSLRRVST